MEITALIEDLRRELKKIGWRGRIYQLTDSDTINCL